MVFGQTLIRLTVSAAALCAAACGQTGSEAGGESAVATLPPVAEGGPQMSVICYTGLTDGPIQYALIENLPGDPAADAGNPRVVAIRDQWVTYLRGEGRVVEQDGALLPRCAARRPEDIPAVVDMLFQAAQGRGGMQQIAWRPAL